MVMVREDDLEYLSVDQAFVRKFARVVHRYEAAVRRSGLSTDTKSAYLMHARRIVRWLRGEYEPGQGL